MILNCTACSSRYLVDPHALGAGGRKVRCAKCGHVWFQELPFGSSELPVAGASQSRAIPKGSNLPSVRSPLTSGRNFLGWATLLLFISGSLAIGFLVRQQAIAIWPPVERLYSLVGMAPEFAGTGFEIHNVKSTRMLEGAAQWLVIKGDVVNVSEQIREVPKLSGKLQDSDGKAVHEWGFVAGDGRLLPGESVTFETKVKDPAVAAVSMVVDFARQD